MNRITKDYDDKARLIHAFAAKFPHAEIAKMFDLSASTAHALISRGRELAIQSEAKTATQSIGTESAA